MIWAMWSARNAERSSLSATITVALQRVAVELLDEAAVMDDADPGRQPVDLSQDVAGHEDGHALLVRQRTEELAAHAAARSSGTATSAAIWLSAPATSA